MSLVLAVDGASATPPYEQVRVQVAGMVATGVLPPGTRLPPIRQLAGDLGLAAGTVARAFRELEADGVVETRGRHGTFVLAPAVVRRTPAEVQRRLEDAARRYALEAVQLGVSGPDALEAARGALRAAHLPSGR